MLKKMETIEDFTMEESEAKWIGAFTQYGTKESPMEIQSLELSPETIKAQGEDYVGRWEIDGGVKKNFVKFIKHYIGKHKIKYEGYMNAE